MIFFQLCNLFCCLPPEVTLSGKFASALRLFLQWMSPELMKTRLTSYVKIRTLSLSSPLKHKPMIVFSCIQDNDVYSLGVLLWEVWSGECPWPNLSPPQLGKILLEEGQTLPITGNHSAISQILDSCFGPPVDRPPAGQFLSQIGYFKTMYSTSASRSPALPRDEVTSNI